MVQRKLLVAYGTSFGQTARIAGRMRELLIAEGFNVTLRELEMSTEIDVDRFDGILIGASIIHGHHQRAVERFARRHRNTLNRVPSAFFSVSGSAASADPRERDTARSLMGSFLASVEWYPDLETTFGGGFSEHYRIGRRAIRPPTRSVRPAFYPLERHLGGLSRLSEGAEPQ